MAELLPNDPTKPIIENPDGTFSTERTVTWGVDGKQVVMPTIINGKAYTPEEALQLYKQGRNPAVGEFATEAEAAAYAQARHLREQATRAADRKPKVPVTVRTKVLRGQR